MVRRASTNVHIDPSSNWSSLGRYAGGLKPFLPILILEPIPTKGRIPNSSVPTSCSTPQIECTLSSSASVVRTPQAPKNRPPKIDAAR